MQTTNFTPEAAASMMASAAYIGGTPRPWTRSSSWARVVVRIPDKGHVPTRYDGCYANRPRGMRRQAESAELPPAIVPAPRLAPGEATRRWATLLQQIFEVDPLACPACHGAMRIVACITQRSVLDQILTHRRTRATTAAHGGARNPPSTRGPSGPGATPRPAAAHRARCVSPRRPAHVRGRSACAPVPPARPIGPRGDRMPTGHAVRTATEPRRRAAGRPLRAGRPSRGTRSRRAFAGYSTDPD